MRQQDSDGDVSVDLEQGAAAPAAVAASGSILVGGAPDDEGALLVVPAAAPPGQPDAPAEDERLPTTTTEAATTGAVAAAAAPPGAAPSGSSSAIPPAMVGSGPEYKHQVRDLTPLSQILVEDGGQPAQPSPAPARRPSDSDIVATTSMLDPAQPPSYAAPQPNGDDDGGDGPVVLAHAQLLPDANPFPEVKPARSQTALSPQKKYYRILAGVAFLVVVIAAVVVPVMLVASGGNDSDNAAETNNETESFFALVGRSLNGPDIDAYFGTALALSQTGDRLAVASPAKVWVFQYSVSEEQWLPLGEPIEAASAEAVGPDGAGFQNTSNPAECGRGEGVPGECEKRDHGNRNNNDNNRELQQQLHLQGENLVSVAMDAMGVHVVIGYEADSRVQVWRYVEETNEWNLVGNSISHNDGDLRFGASVSMSGAGNFVAVGAPGPDDSAGYCFVYQRNLVTGDWDQIGQTIEGQPSMMNVTQLGRSVSLSAESAEGLRVAVGGRTSAATRASSAKVFSNVVSVYGFDVFGNRTWTEVGTGISRVPSTKDTGWYVDLDASGNRLAVSSTYLDPADYNNTDPEALMANVYEFQNDTWVDFGKGFHAYETGPRSGYVISLSDDGLTVAMGDCGTDEGGRSRGHAHIYKYNNTEWIQQGPNVNGTADGDNFGFAVAISGDGTVFAAGAPYSRAAHSDAGQVIAFQIPE